MIVAASCKDCAFANDGYCYYHDCNVKDNGVCDDYETK